MIIKDENIKQILKELGILHLCELGYNQYDHYEYFHNELLGAENLWFVIISYTDNSLIISIGEVRYLIQQDKKDSIKKALIKRLNERLGHSKEAIEDAIFKHIEYSKLLKSIIAGG